MNTLPFYVSAIILTGVIAEVATVSSMLWRGARRSGAARHTANVVAVGFAVGWAAWVVVSMTLAAAHLYRFAPGRAQPWLPLVMIAATTALLLATRIRSVSRVLAQPDVLWRLTASQVFRVVGVAFLIAMALGKLPAVFAVPAGLGDIAVGVEAVFLTRRIRRGVTGRGVVIFNLLGLLDLVIALTLAVTSAPGALHLLAPAPSTVQVSLLPLVLIPTTLVPLAVALHVLSLRNLAAAGRRVPASEHGSVRATAGV